MTPRILFVTPRYGSIQRGVEVFTHELVLRLSQLGWTCSILSDQHDETLDGVHYWKAPVLRRERLEPVLRRFGVRDFAHRLRLGPAEVEARSLTRAADRLAMPRDFDVVMPLGGTYCTAWARRRWPSARLVGVGQAGVVPGELAYLDAFVALTTDDVEAARKRRLQLDVALIPNGVDLDRFVPAQVAPRERLLACVGAFVEDKGYDHLLSAFERLDETCRLICVGAGPLEGWLRAHPLMRTGRLRIETRRHADMPALFQSARAFTLASPGEAFGIVFLEALATELPVVAHGRAQLRGILGDCGRFVDVRDSAAYAEALKAALDEGPQVRFRSRAAQFGWDAIARRYDEYLRKLIKR